MNKFNWKKYDRFSDWYDYPNTRDYYDSILNYGRNKTVFFEPLKIRTVTKPADRIAKHLNNMKENTPDNKLIYLSSCYVKIDDKLVQLTDASTPATPDPIQAALAATAFKERLIQEGYDVMETTTHQVSPPPHPSMTIKDYYSIQPLPEEGTFFQHFNGCYCKSCGDIFALYSYSAYPTDGVDENNKPFYDKCSLCNKK